MVDGGSRAVAQGPMYAAPRNFVLCTLLSRCRCRCSPSWMPGALRTPLNWLVFHSWEPQKFTCGVPDQVKASKFSGPRCRRSRTLRRQNRRRPRWSSAGGGAGGPVVGVPGEGHHDGDRGRSLVQAARVRLAFPVALVVPVQLWAVLPEPSVMGTGRPPSGLPSVVRLEDMVNGIPPTATVWPV